MANRLRLLLLLVTLVGLLTGAAWVWYPRGVQELGWALADRWSRPTVQALREADSLRSQDKLVEADRVLADAIESMGELQVKDSFDRLWRQAMQDRIEITEKLGRIDESISLARRYQQHAPQDMPNVLQLGELLLKTEDGADEGMQLLSDIQAILPEWSPVANAYAAALIERGRDREAVEVGLAFLRRSRGLPQLDWMLYWDAGKGLIPQHTASFEFKQTGKPNEFQMSRILPGAQAPMTELRVNTPTYPCFRMLNWSVSVTAGDDVVVIDKRSQLKKSSGLLKSKGEVLEPRWMSRPSFSIKLAKPIQMDGKTRIDIHMTLEQKLPPSVIQLLNDQERKREILSWLRSEKRQADVSLLQEAMGN